MATFKMVKSIKENRPNCVALFKEGVFYCAYMNDAYIIAGMYAYKIRDAGGFVSCRISRKINSKNKN